MKIKHSIAQYIIPCVRYLVLYVCHSSAQKHLTSFFGVFVAQTQTAQACRILSTSGKNARQLVLALVMLLSVQIFDLMLQSSAEEMQYSWRSSQLVEQRQLPLGWVVRAVCVDNPLTK